MLRTRMKTTTLIDIYKEENIETESQIEVDNGVHPLLLGYVSGSLSNAYRSN